MRYSELRRKLDNRERVLFGPQPTAHIRFYERLEPLPGQSGPNFVCAPVRTLQQLWKHAQTGEEEWRDIPVSTEEQR